MKFYYQSAVFIFSFLTAPVLSQVDYSDQIQPIFDNNCIGCHGGINNLYLDSYPSLMAGSSTNGPVIISGDSDNSILVQKILGTAGFGDRMPSNDPTYFDSNSNDLQLIKNWIDQGATLENSPEQVVKIFQINPIYPNPFNPSTTISWEQPISENVQINIFYLKGELSDEFLFTKSQPGAYNFNWHPVGLPAGIYFIRILGETFTVTQRAVYLK